MREVEQELIRVAIVTDLFRRRVVGWQLHQYMTESLVLEALRKAIRARQPSPGLLHHSERGGQDAGKVYRATLTRLIRRYKLG